MSSEIAIEVQNLSKCYRIYNQPQHRLLQMVDPRDKKYYREFWALNNISFQIKKGETVGIIGRNGSGKSTLLQLVCGTLNPTSGKITCKGRVAALLELGSGFNPDFTGRENVYLNASILGLSQNEINLAFGAIIEFADIGDFLDQPVKTYSSGMMVRLAFAVAIHSNPSILVVDEALSVGDELFQRKCFSRIEAIRASGATILFVSHSGSQIIELCNRAVLLDAGEQLLIGPPKEVVGKYQKLIYSPQDRVKIIRKEIQETSESSKENLEGNVDGFSQGYQIPVLRDLLKRDQEEFFDENIEIQNAKTMLHYESQGAWIDTPFILTRLGRRVNCLKRGETYRYCYRVRFDQGATKVRFSMLVKTISGMELGGAMSAPTISEGITYIQAGRYVNVEFEFLCNLNPNIYFLNAGVVGISDAEETFLHRVLDLIAFRVLPVEGNTSTAVIDFKCIPKLEIIS